MFTQEEKNLIGKRIATSLIVSFTVASNFVFDDFIEDGGSMARWVLLIPAIVGLYFDFFNKRLLPFVLNKKSIRNFYLTILGILSLMPTVLGKFVVSAEKGSAYYNSEVKGLLIQDLIPFVSAFFAVVALTLLLTKMNDAADFVESGSNLAEITIIHMSVVFVIALQATLYDLDMRQFSVSNINRIIYLIICVAYVYCAFTAAWHLLRKIIFNIKKNTKWFLYGKYQLLPWILLLYPITCLYTLNMYIWFNLLSVIITPILILGSYLAFDYANKLLSSICGVIFLGLYAFVGASSFNLDESPLLVGLLGVIMLEIVAIIMFVKKPWGNDKKHREHIEERGVDAGLPGDSDIKNHKNYYLISIYIVMVIAVLFVPPRKLNRDWINQYTDVTTRYIDQIVTIQSCAQGEGSYDRYISTNFEDNRQIQANRSLADSWEKFEVKLSRMSSKEDIELKNKDVYVVFRPIEGEGRYITAMMNKNPSPLAAESYAPWDWESFRILEKDGWNYIVTKNHDIFLTVSNDKTSNPVEARDDIKEPGTWERLAISIADSNQDKTCDDIKN